MKAEADAGADTEATGRALEPAPTRSATPAATAATASDDKE